MKKDRCQICGADRKAHVMGYRCGIYMGEPNPPTIQWSALPGWDEAAPITPEQLAAVERWINAKRG